MQKKNVRRLIFARTLTLGIATALGSGFAFAQNEEPFAQGMIHYDKKDYTEALKWSLYRNLIEIASLGINRFIIAGIIFNP